MNWISECGRSENMYMCTAVHKMAVQDKFSVSLTSLPYTAL
jgi:hypothetical protein